MVKGDNPKENAVRKASRAMDEDPTLSGKAAACKYHASYYQLLARRGVVLHRIRAEDTIKSSLHHKIQP
jgi:hypothetical protein